MNATHPVDTPPVENEPTGTAPVEVDNRLQLLWLSLSQRPWSSLLLLPTHSGPAIFDFAVRLTTVGRRSTSTRLVLADARQTHVEGIVRVKDGLENHVAQGSRVLLLVDPVVENPASLEIARATDAALLCITYGESNLDAARRTLDLCGREFFVGSVAIQPPSKKRGKGRAE